MQARRTTTHSPSLATPARQALLRHLILTSLQPSPLTATFFAERLYALDATLEPSVFLLALALSGRGRHTEVIWLLRQPVVYPMPEGSSTDHNNNLKNRTTLSSSRIPRPSCESSLRCARLYASSCLALGREKEGREVLTKLLQSGSTLIAPEPTSDPSSSPYLYADREPWVLELELARLSKRAGEQDSAMSSYRKVLESNSGCWEALEGLCALGVPPDTDVLYPARPRLIPTMAISPVLALSRPPPPSLPLPLGPSQSSAVNSAGPSSSKARYASTAIGKGEGLGLFTPGDNSGAAVSKARAAFGQGWTTKMMSQNSSDHFDLSADDSLYPARAPAPAFQLAPPNNGSYKSALPAAARAAPSTSLFTPPETTIATAAPGVKRARGQTTTLAVPMVKEEDKVSRRAMKGVPSPGTSRKSNGGGSIEVRRSTRLSREPSSSSIGASSVASGSMVKSRSQTTISNPRDKKRSKSGTGPSVLSDNGSEAFSPRSRNSRSSSPSASSPAMSRNQAQIDPAVQEAQDYVAEVLRSFAIAACCASQYESTKSIDALMTLPAEQQRSWRCWIGIARAHFEMLQYEKAEKAFAQARLSSPHLLESMELYSTLLWHLRRPTALSFLGQDLTSISPQSSSAWIASGNVFSHLEDHAAALKCFKRAAQLDENCVYAYTLSGHECVVLEEWERALGFFREAVKRDGRHYNAWFGLGNVYMQTGKYRLAEYHFRKAADINPTNAMLVCCVGSVLEKLGRKKEALELYERACLLAPDSPAVRFKRVRVLMSLQQYHRAEFDLLNLKNTAPNEFNVNFLLGKLYIQLNRRAEATKYFAFAQELAPSNGAAIREQLESKGQQDDSTGISQNDIAGMELDDR